VAPPLVAGDGVDLIDDDRPHRAQHLARPLGGEDQVERFGRGDEDMRRLFHHRLAVGLGRVACAEQRADFAVGADLGQRLGQILLDVVREGLEG
jgi:hypothetical protein